MDGAPVPAQIWTSSFRFSCSRLGVPEETPARPRPGRPTQQTTLRVVRLRNENTGAWAAAQQTEHWMPRSESRKEPAQFHQNSQKVGERWLFVFQRTEKLTSIFAGGTFHQDRKWPFGLRSIPKGRNYILKALLTVFEIEKSEFHNQKARSSNFDGLFGSPVFWPF